MPGQAGEADRAALSLASLRLPESSVIWSCRRLIWPVCQIGRGLSIRLAVFETLSSMLLISRRPILRKPEPRSELTSLIRSITDSPAASLRSYSSCILAPPCVRWLNAQGIGLSAGSRDLVPWPRSCGTSTMVVVGRDKVVRCVADVEVVDGLMIYVSAVDDESVTDGR